MNRRLSLLAVLIVGKFFAGRTWAAAPGLGTNISRSWQAEPEPDAHNREI